MMADMIPRKITAFVDIPEGRWRRKQDRDSLRELSIKRNAEAMKAHFLQGRCESSALFPRSCACAWFHLAGILLSFKSVNPKFFQQNEIKAESR